jgi:osmotically-inducible protein OsmY
MRGSEDKAISQQVNVKLAGRGLGRPCRVDVQTLSGQVTLSGTVQFAHQKGAAVKIAGAVRGVRRVLDKITVAARVPRR